MNLLIDPETRNTGYDPRYNIVDRGTYKLKYTHKKEITEQEKEIIARLYYEGVHTVDIAKRFNISRKYIYEIVRKKGNENKI